MRRGLDERKYLFPTSCKKAKSSRSTIGMSIFCHVFDRLSHLRTAWSSSYIAQWAHRIGIDYWHLSEGNHRI